MRDVAADIAAILEAAGLGLTTGTNLWIGQLLPEGDPDTPDKAAAVLQTGGGSPQSYIGGGQKAFLNVTCQVRLRGDREDPQAAFTLACACAKALNQIAPDPYTSITVRESSPTWLGTDTSDRPLWSFNVSAEYRDTGTTPPLVSLPDTTLAADRVTVDPIAGLSADDVQDALAELAAREVDLSPVEADIAALQAADATLQGNIDAEVSARANAVSAEATARANAVTAEATARDAADQSIISSLAAYAKLAVQQTWAEIQTFAKGIALGAKLTFNGIASGANALEIEDGTRIASKGSTGQYIEAVSNGWKFNQTASQTSPGNHRLLYMGSAVSSLGLYVGLGDDSTPRVYFETAGVVGRGGAVHIVGRNSNSAEAIGVILDTDRNQTNAGAKISSGRNGNVEKFFFDKEGNLEVVGAGGTVFLRSANNSRWAITVSNAGALVVTAA